jgi:hypothetical protein
MIRVKDKFIMVKKNEYGKIRLHTGENHQPVASHCQTVALVF